MLHATRTDDVQLEALNLFREELQPEFGVDWDEYPFMQLSVEPPSWIQLLAQADWWIGVLGAGAALYVAELIREAAKETWKSRAKLITLAVDSGSALFKFARSLLNLRRRIVDRSDIAIGLPVPDEHWGSRLCLVEREDVSILAGEIAIFVHHLPELKRLIETEGLREDSVLGGLFLEITENGSLKVEWMDNSESMVKHERILPLNAT